MKRARLRRRTRRNAAPRAALAGCLAVLLVCLLNPGAASGAGGVPDQIGSPSVRSGVNSLSLDFTTPADHGSPITKYVASCSNATTTVTASAADHPVVVKTLSNNVFYSCTVRAFNANGGGFVSYVAPGMPGLNYVKTTYTYCSPGGDAQLMDFFRPPGTAIVPVVMFVHGGGWNSGSRVIDASLMATLFTSRGFALASVDYRLAPAVKPPDQVRDIACAVRYLRANASRLGISPALIGGIGRSAGGNLLTMLALRPPTMPAGSQFTGQSEKVQAVVDEFGITEFGPDQMAMTPKLSQVFGTTDQSIIDSYAPLPYVSSDDPPFLITHGTLDSTVPVHEGQDLFERLQQFGVPATFLPIAHTGHMYAPVDANPEPTLNSVFAQEINFFNSNLR